MARIVPSRFDRTSGGNSWEGGTRNKPTSAGAPDGPRPVARPAALLAGFGFLFLASGCSLFTHGQSNNGTIAFGFGFHRVSAHQIDIVKPRTTFYKGQTIGWVAYLRKPAGSPVLRMTITSATDGRTVLTRQVRNVNPHWVQLADSVHFSVFPMLHIYAPGKYILRYYRGAHLLAQGTFRLRR